MPINLNEAVELNFTSIREAAEELGELKGWNLDSAKGLMRCLPMIVRKTEEVGKLRDLTGAEKNEFAVLVLLKLIKLPWWLPTNIVKPLLEGVISAICDIVFAK